MLQERKEEEKMSEILNFITTNQYLIIVAIVALAYVASKFIDYMAKKNPGIDQWDHWQPTSAHVASMVFQGAEWWGSIKAKSGDEKLQEYLRKLKEFEHDFSSDKLQAVQKILAWYFSLKAKAPAPNPSIALRQIGPDDAAERGLASRSTPDA